MYLYVQVLLYANKQYGIFVMFEFNFFVFNLSPWPFLDRREQLILLRELFFPNSLYLVVEEILIKFYSVCQLAAIYGVEHVCAAPKPIRFSF
jgi:hypothetical protein